MFNRPFREGECKVDSVHEHELRPVHPNLGLAISTDRDEIVDVMDSPPEPTVLEDGVNLFFHFCENNVITVRRQSFEILGLQIFVQRVLRDVLTARLKRGREKLKKTRIYIASEIVLCHDTIPDIPLRFTLRIFRVASN